MFLLTLFANPLFRKIAIIVVCVASVGLAIRWYGNRQYAVGKQAGIVEESKRLLEAKQQEWQAKEVEIQTRIEALAKAEKSRAAVDAELRRMRASMDESLAKIQAANQAQTGAAHEIISSIPGDLLDDSIRRKSTELGPPAKTVK